MKKKSIAKENAKKDTIDYLNTSASNTDCTGVVYTGLMSDAELDNLNEVYPFEPKPAEPPKHMPHD